MRGSATSGSYASGKVIAPSSNEIRYCVNPSVLIPAASSGHFHLFYSLPRATARIRR